MKKYVVKANSYTHLSVVKGSTQRDLGANETHCDVEYDEKYFCNYKKCDCCDEIVATFVVKRFAHEDGTLVSYYMQTNAENVIEIEGGRLANAA